MLRFEDAIHAWTERRLTQEEAAQLLCERTFRRHVDRYEEAGLDGLLDKRLSQVSARRAPVDVVLLEKPDRSCATKNGQFYLPPTRLRKKT